MISFMVHVIMIINVFINFTFWATRPNSRSVLKDNIDLTGF